MNDNFILIYITRRYVVNRMKGQRIFMLFVLLIFDPQLMLAYMYMTDCKCKKSKR